MDDISKELGKLLSEEERKLCKARNSFLKTRRELIYEQLLLTFNEEARQLGSWVSENGVQLDGKLWRLSERIVDGDFDNIRLPVAEIRCTCGHKDDMSKPYSGHDPTCPLAIPF